MPATIGDHIDHRIVRQAGVELSETFGMDCFLYEDMPYANTKGLEFLDSHIAKLQKQLNKRLNLTYFDMSTLRDFKRQSIVCYESQITDPEIDLILDHALKLGCSNEGERFWQVC